MLGVPREAAAGKQASRHQVEPIAPFASSLAARDPIGKFPEHVGTDFPAAVAMHHVLLSTGPWCPGQAVQRAELDQLPPLHHEPPVQVSAWIGSVLPDQLLLYHLAMQLLPASRHQ